MLSFEECRKIAERLVAEKNADNLAFAERINDPERYDELALLDWNDASEFCFAFTYNSKKYLETGDFLDCVVGQGPVIIDRRNGLVIETGSSYPKDYLENYEVRGDPYKNIGSTVLIYETGTNSQTISAIQILRQHTALGLKDAKEAIETVLDGGKYKAETNSDEVADKLVTKLKPVGFNARRI